MSRFRWKIAARLVLLAALVGGGLWLSRLDYTEKISTNVIDLIPPAEREPEVTALRRLANETHARIVWCTLTTAGGQRPDPGTIDAFLRGLHASPAFAEVRLAHDQAAREELGGFLHQRRFLYLLPGYIEEARHEFASSGSARAWPEWLAERVGARLEDFLLTPESGAFEAVIPSDPLLLLPGLVEDAEWLMPATEAGANHALIWLRLAASPLEPAGQEPAMAALTAALEDARQLQPDVVLEWTGVNRFAAASKARIRSELAWLNGLSIAGVLLVTTLLIRQPWRIFHLLPIVLLSLLGGWVAVTVTFDRVHILVFVVGALLTGAAVDYGFHLFLDPAAQSGRSLAVRLAPVLKPLAASCLTTVIGFCLLLFSDLPLLRHVGVFVSAGLVAAAMAALVYFVAGNGPIIEPRGARRLLPPPWRRLLLVLLPLLVVAALAGSFRITWWDDIRSLEVPSPDLQRNDRLVRARFGESAGRPAFLTTGADMAEARSRLAEFERWYLREGGQALASVGSFLPPPATYAAAQDEAAGLEGFAPALRRVLDESGFDAGAFEPFFADWSAYLASSPPSYGVLVAELRRHLQGPASLLIDEGGGQAWLLALGDRPLPAPPPAELRTVEVNQLQSLNRLFQRYRENALQLSLVGLGLIGLSVLALYGWRTGLQIMVVPLASCALAFGLLGWLQPTLNLFHLLGAFLGVCLSHDYAIFYAYRGRASGLVPASVRLAALTTAASFGVLAFSRIPVVSALGSTVTLIVLIGLLLVECSAARRNPS